MSEPQCNSMWYAMLSMLPSYCCLAGSEPSLFLSIFSNKCALAVCACANFDTDANLACPATQKLNEVSLTSFANFLITEVSVLLHSKQGHSNSL